MLIASSGLKRGLYACSPDERLASAVEATRGVLAELEQRAKRFHFKVVLVTVHPYQELDGAFRRTEQLVRAAAPSSFVYVAGASRFRKEDYYPYDGHFNAQGHARMAALIAEYLPGP
jgi:hypothetical protein